MAIAPSIFDRQHAQRIWNGIAAEEDSDTWENVVPFIGIYKVQLLQCRSMQHCCDLCEFKGNVASLHAESENRKHAQFDRRRLQRIGEGVIMGRPSVRK